MPDHFGVRLADFCTVPPTSGDALGRWIGHRLRGAFDGVLAEPLPKELLGLLEEAADECAPLRPPRELDRVQDADRVLDSMDAAECAAYDVGQRFGEVRAHVYSARAAASGLPALTLPVEEFAAQTKGIPSCAGAVWAEVPGTAFGRQRIF